MQAAEVLDVGGRLRGLKVLELGGGAGVWSAAMAYRDPKMHVTTVDHAHHLAHCQATYASIGLESRWTPIADDYRHWSIPLGQFDLVILPEVMQLESDAAAVILLGRAADALREGGQVVITESLREPDGPTEQLALKALELAVATGGLQRSANEIQQLLRGAGLTDAQWGWLTASAQGLGLIVSDKRQASE
jgi:demethylspheroidene O-methyltransferase